MPAVVVKTVLTARRSAEAVCPAGERCVLPRRVLVWYLSVATLLVTVLAYTSVNVTCHSAPTALMELCSEVGCRAESLPGSQ